MNAHTLRFLAKPAALAAAAIAVVPAAPAAAAGTGRSAAASRPVAVGPPAAAGRPVAAPQPDPFGGGIPGDASAGNGALPPVRNPPNASAVILNALPGAHPAQNRFGTIDDVDRLFLISVRQAGLWERPTCLRAEQQAQSARLKDICQILAADHQQLDAEDRYIAQQLDVGLPDQPTADQQSWMRQFWVMQGHDFDVTAVHWLRFGHGAVFSAIAAVRAGTRNELMRLYAERANAMVNKHMSLLESTGLVQYDALPHAAIGAAAAALAAAKVPTLDGQTHRTQRDIDLALNPKKSSLLQPPVVALLVVAVLLTIVSIRRVVKGG